MTKQPPHVFACDAVQETLEPLIPPGWWLRKEDPVRIPDFDEPEPDFSLGIGACAGLPVATPGAG